MFRRRLGDSKSWIHVLRVPSRALARRARRRGNEIPGALRSKVKARSGAEERVTSMSKAQGWGRRFKSRAPEMVSDEQDDFDVSAVLD